jgi:hypothetical protein
VARLKVGRRPAHGSGDPSLAVGVRVQGGSAALFDGVPPEAVAALGQRLRPSLADLFVALTRQPEIQRPADR